MTTAILDQVSPAITDGINLTPTAAGKLGEIIQQKGLTASYGLRVFVQGGGCGGMQYGMTFEDSPREDDEVYEQHGLKVYIDPVSLFYVSGARIDWVDSLMGGGFNIENPNATSSCGCGSSFRTSHSHTGDQMPDSCSN